MKKYLLPIFCFIIFFNLNAFSYNQKAIQHSKSYSEIYKGAKGFGAGIVFGMSSGISLKNWLNRESALQFDISWDFNWGGFGVGVAYLFHNYKLINVKETLLPFYFGIKGWIGIAKNSMAIGAQVPIGIVWIPRDAPIDVFLQIEPGISLIPSTSFAPNAGVGIRYYF